MIDQAIRSLICERLDSIEREENVRILYACESGSRAWGFESTDSDYDVRFIYAHDLNWYLSYDVERCRDVIEKPIDADIDIGGWDLRKTLALMAKSNPPLLEWLVSPIVYRDLFQTGERLRQLLRFCYSPKACAHHYLHMARNNFRQFFAAEEVKQKKYFYVLRPILAVEWIHQDLGPVPMEFETLVSRLVPDGRLKDEIYALLALKREGAEMGLAPRNELICDFMQSELERTSTFSEETRGEIHQPRDELNRVFRELLSDVSESR
jgi:predicted nucleotidyltransferase